MGGERVRGGEKRYSTRGFVEVKCLGDVTRWLRSALVRGGKREEGGGGAAHRSAAKRPNQLLTCWSNFPKLSRLRFRSGGSQNLEIVPRVADRARAALPLQYTAKCTTCPPRSNSLINPLYRNACWEYFMDVVVSLFPSAGELDWARS